MTRRRRRSKRRLFKRINKRDVIHAHTYHNTVLMGKQREISFLKMFIVSYFIAQLIDPFVCSVKRIQFLRTAR
jgi:hypothetical protein